MLLGAATIFLAAQPRIPGLTSSVVGSLSVPRYNLSREYWVALLLVTVISFAVVFHRDSLSNSVGIFPYALVAIALVSVSWSTDRVESLTYVAQLIAWTVLAVVISSYLSPRQIYLSLSIACVLMLSLSAFYIAFFPLLGRTIVGRSILWRGAFNNQNDFGRWVVISTALVVIGLLVHRRLGITRLTLLVMLFIAIKMSGSAQAMTISIALCIFVALVVTKRRHPRWMPVLMGLGLILTGIVGAVAMIVANRDHVSLADLTFTSRVPLWLALGKEIENNPLLGHGANSFWSDEAVSVTRARASAGFEASQAHSSYIEASLQYGVFGGLFLVFWFISCIRRLTLSYVRSGEPYILMAACLFLFIAIYSLSASVVASPQFSWWFVLVLASSVAHREFYQAEYIKC